MLNLFIFTGTEWEEIKGQSGKTPIAGIDFPIPKNGHNGKDADEEKIISKLTKIIRKLIPKPIRGDKGDSIVGKQGAKGIDGKPPEHEIAYNRIRFKNPDGTWGAWLDIEKRDTGRSRGTLHRGGLDLVRDDLSSQCDGSTTTFTLTATPKADTVQLYSTQFPIIYRPEVDFTVDVSANTVSLETSEVGAPKSGQTLVAMYVKS